jgi:thioredoxin 1
MSAETAITTANFDQEVLQSDQPVIVDFWAPWCGPCKAFATTLAEFAENHPNIKVCKCNVDDAPEIGQRFNVMSIPTIVFFNGGKALETAVGNMTLRELTKRVETVFAS